MGSVLFCFETHAAVGTNTVSSRCYMMVKNSMQGPAVTGESLQTKLHAARVQLAFPSTRKFYDMVTAADKCHSGICIVAVLEIDTQREESAIASRISSLPGNIALAGDRYSKGDLPPSQHVARRKKHSISFQKISMASLMLQLWVIGILG